MAALRTTHYACAPRLCNYILASGVLIEDVIAISHNCYHGDSNQRLKYHIFSSNQVLTCSNTGELTLSPFIYRGIDHGTLFYDMPVCMKGELCLEMVKDIIYAVRFLIPEVQSYSPLGKRRRSGS